VRSDEQPDLRMLTKQAQRMQQQMADVQAELAGAELTGTAGGGLVTITVNGTGEATAVTIDPRAVDPKHVEALEDLVLTAIHNAAGAVRGLAEQKFGPLTSGLRGLSGGF
jgi:nucleoid-associated protein EbfC